MTCNNRDEGNHLKNDLIKENIQCRLYEYESWNNFLHINWQQRYVLLGLNVAALSTLISIAITHINGNLFTLFLFLASFISSTVGLVWLAETRWAITIMDLLQEHSMKELEQLTKDETLFYASKQSRGVGKDHPIKHAIRGRSPVATIGVFIFLIPSLISWIVAFSTMLLNSPFANWSDRVLYIILAFISVALLGYLIWNGLQVKNEWQNSSKK